MQKITFDNTYFSPRDTLECGQIFRFKPYREGYIVYSRDRACYLYTQNNSTVIECEDPDYFYNFFDLGRDYAAIIQKIKEFNIPVLTHSAEACKGLRLLRQDAEETVFSFILSQNNNIPRIKGIIERICLSLGEKREFAHGEFNAFPSASALAKKDAAFYRALGAGYRDEFIVKTAVRIAEEGLGGLQELDPKELKKRLLTYCGIGPKVADCIALFGFGKAASFPVDTWIEKLYREDFGGTLSDRNKINEYFTQLFGEYSGYAQQYLFYGKRANL